MLMDQYLILSLFCCFLTFFSIVVGYKYILVLKQILLDALNALSFLLSQSLLVWYVGTVLYLLVVYHLAGYFLYFFCVLAADYNSIFLRCYAGYHYIVCLLVAILWWYSFIKFILQIFLFFWFFTEDRKKILMRDFCLFVWASLVALLSMWIILSYYWFVMVYSFFPPESIMEFVSTDGI